MLVERERFYDDLGKRNIRNIGQEILIFWCRFYRVRFSTTPYWFFCDPKCLDHDCEESCSRLPTYMNLNNVTSLQIFTRPWVDFAYLTICLA